MSIQTQQGSQFEVENIHSPAMVAKREAAYYKLPRELREYIDSGGVLDPKNPPYKWVLVFLANREKGKSTNSIVKHHKDFKDYLEAGGSVPVPKNLTVLSQLVDGFIPTPDPIVSVQAPAVQPVPPAPDTNSGKNPGEGGRVSSSSSESRSNNSGVFSGLIAGALVVILLIGLAAFHMWPFNATGTQTADNAAITAQLDKLTEDVNSGKADYAKLQQQLDKIEASVGANNANYLDQFKQIQAAIALAIQNNGGTAVAGQPDATQPPSGQDTTASPEPTTPTESTGTMPNLPVSVTQGSWTISENAKIGDDPIVRDWLARLKNPAPARWKTFPNVPNKDVQGFRVDKTCSDDNPKTNDCVPDGMEYGVANVPFCQQDMRCDFVVPAQHYRLITADYEFLGESCKQADNGGGCMLLLINVGGETYTWRNQIADNGFSVPGRYFNGDTLEWGVWGLVSHASANMLNMPTSAHPDESLNFGSGTNGGANCGVPNACDSVNVTVVVHAGDRIIAVAKTTVTRP